MSSFIASRIGRVPGRSRIDVVLTAARVLAASVFLLAASTKMAGLVSSVDAFERLGLEQWFGYVAAPIEVVGAVLLLVRDFAVFGAALLAAIMGCAWLLHVAVLDGSAVAPFVLCATMLVLWRLLRGRSPAGTPVRP